MKIKVISLSFILFFGLSLFGDDYHTIQSGDTLYSLSRRYGLSVSEIQRLNPKLNPQRLALGDRVKVSEGESNSAYSDNNAEFVHNSGTGNYTVKSGDTLYSLARNWGIPVQELFRLNGFNSNTLLYVGQKVKKPGRDNLPEPAIVVENNPTPDYPKIETPIVVKTSITSAANDSFWPIEGNKKALAGKIKGVSINSTGDSIVNAVSSGQVIYTGPHRTFGEVIMIDHDGYIYLYGGNSSIFVNVGETVSQGTRLGEASGEVLFSVWKNDRFIDVNSAPRG